MAAAVSLPNTLTNGQPNDAAQVMADLNALVTWINTNAPHLDATKAFTGVVTGPATDPTTANQYTRKAWVDAQVAAEAASRVAGDLNPRRHSVGASLSSAQSIPANVETAMIWSNEDWDSDAYFTPGSTGIVIPATHAGIYAVCWSVRLQNNSAACHSQLYVNGALYVAGGEGQSTDAAAKQCSNGIAFCSLGAGDIVSIRVLHAVGDGGTNCLGTFTIARLSA